MDLSGNYITEFNTLTDCSKYLKTSRSNVKIVCNSIKNSKDEKISKTVKDHLVCYKEDYKNNKFILDKTLGLEKIINTLKKNHIISTKPIYKYDDAGKFIKKFERGIDADKELNLPLYSCSNIASRNNREEYINKLNGYYWFYEEVDFSKAIKVKRKNGVISIKLNK